MLRLHTFGEVFITRDEGDPLTGAATQRRSLALVTLLATSGDGGLSREKLVGLLWPDSDPERARHSLTQTLYTTRRALNEEELFTVTPSIVRLNHDRLGSDARELDTFLNSGQLEQAAALYTAPFLDGFFVSGAPEFERWSSAQRNRYRQRITQVLEQLASRAEHAHSNADALMWRQRLAAIAPLDAANAAGLMAAMAQAGDRAGAIRYARIHATLLREELDMDPDPSIEHLAASLRSRTAPPESVPATANIEAGDRDEGDANDPQQEPQPAPTRTPPTVIVEGPQVTGTLHTARSHAPHAMSIAPPPLHVPLHVRWAVLSVIISVLVGTGVLLGRARSTSSVGVHKLAVPQNVVVAPFRVAGADPSLAYLRDGVVELLSARLADDSAARSVDAGAVLGAWRSAGLSPTMDVPRASVVALATRLGAKRVVVGSVVGTAARMVLTATVLTLPSGAVSGQAAVTGPADSISSLLDRLAARLLVSEAGQDEDLSHHVSRSLPALRAYLAGQASFRRGDYKSALRSYAVALRRDSSFALAALYQALSADRLSLDAPLRMGTATAWTSRDELSERDRSRLFALSGPRFPALATGDELATAWQHMIDIASANADTWYELALRLLHDGGPAGIADVRQRTTGALLRALAIDSTHAEARRLLADLAARDSAFAHRNAADIPGRRTELHDRESWQLRAFALSSQINAVSLDDGARALQLLEGRELSRPARLDLTLAEHSVALNRGEWSGALDATNRLRKLQPGSRAWLRLRVLDRLYGDSGDSVAAVAARSLAEAVGSSMRAISGTTEDWLADACVLAQWRLFHGDTSQAAGTIARLRQWNRPWSGSAVSASPVACAELLDAFLASSLGRPDARARLAHLDALAFTPQAAGDANAYAPSLVARLHERIGDIHGAVRALQNGRPVVGWPRYLAAMSLREGLLAERIADTASARSAYRRFLALRSRSHARPDTLVTQIEDRLTRLEVPASGALPVR